MTIERLEQDILRFRFDPDTGQRFGYNVYALTDGSRALLVDAGLEWQGGAVAEWLAGEGVRVEAVVISHFHPDHIGGLKALSAPVTYGSHRYNETLGLPEDGPALRLLAPTRQVSSPESLSFGRHRLLLTPRPGHTACTVVTDINGRYLHVADELIYSNEGEPILPFVSLSGNEAQRASLEILMGVADRVFLTGHGPALRDGAAARDDMRNRLRYLERVHASGGHVSYEEGISDCSKQFLCPEWHSANCH